MEENKIVAQEKKNETPKSIMEEKKMVAKK